MKTTISETIDGSMKDILQLKTVDNSLEYAQLFDALEDCPDDFKSKLIGALNSLSQTMGISPDSVFDKVLCASEDENAKKKLYNWWKAVFEVISKSVPNIPEDRRQEYEEKLDALISEICKSGDKASGNDVVLEDYEPADIEEEDKLKEGMTFAASKIGEIAKKAEELVNFLNPYCESVGGKEDIMNENEAADLGAKDISKLIWDSQDDEMEVLESYPPKKDGSVKFDVFIKNNGQLGEHVSIDDIVGLAEDVFGDILCDTGWEFEVVPANEDNIIEMWNGADFDGKVDVYNDQTRLGDSDGATFQITCIKANGQFNEVDSTMKKIDERGGSDWVSMDDMIGMEVGESDEEPINGDDEKKIVIANAKKTAKKDGYDQYILFDKSDNSWAFERKHIQTKEDFAKFGQEVVGIVRAEDLKFVPFALESGVEPLDEYEFLDKMLDDAEDTNDVFDVYDGNVIEDGTVALNVTVYKDDMEDWDVKEEFRTMPRKYGWEYEGWEYSNDVPGEEGTESIVVYFRPQKKRINEMKNENELDIGDDGWREIGQPVGEAKASVWCVVLSDGTEKKFKCSKDEAKTKAKELAEKEGLEVKRVYPVLYPKNPYKRIFKEATVTVDANDVWDVLDLLDDEEANKNLTDLINSHVRTEEEIMDAIDGWCDGTVTGEAVTKAELNDLIANDMESIVVRLGLDVEQFKKDGSFVDPEKPVALESDWDEKPAEREEAHDKPERGTKAIVNGQVVDADSGYARFMCDAQREFKKRHWEENTDEENPDEIKDGEKKYKQDGETKTLDFGENKKPVCEMTIEQEVTNPWKLLELLWGQGKENFEELLRSNLFSDDRIMSTLEEFEVRDLTNLNDLLAYDFEQVLEALGCDVEAWTQHLEIQKA